jgi:hypothetical protein
VRTFIPTVLLSKACFRSYGTNNNDCTICSYNVSYSNIGILFYLGLSRTRPPPATEAEVAVRKWSEKSAWAMILQGPPMAAQKTVQRWSSERGWCSEPVQGGSVAKRWRSEPVQGRNGQGCELVL